MSNPILFGFVSIPILFSFLCLNHECGANWESQHIISSPVWAVCLSISDLFLATRDAHLCFWLRFALIVRCGVVCKKAFEAKNRGRSVQIEFHIQVVSQKSNRRRRRKKKLYYVNE